VKGSRSLWLGRTGKVLTVGFSRTSDRQYAVWDPSNFGTALVQENIDTGSGLLMPFFDPDSSIIFLAGKVRVLSLESWSLKLISTSHNRHRETATSATMS